MIPIILVSLLVLYFIGKYISANNKDKNNTNTAKFGDGLSGFAKNTGCLIISVIAIILAIGMYFFLKSIFGGYTTP